jgi:hypothetical protein
MSKSSGHRRRNKPLRKRLRLLEQAIEALETGRRPGRLHEKLRPDSPRVGRLRLIEYFKNL